MKRICLSPIFCFVFLGLMLTNSCTTEVDPKLLPVLTTTDISKITEASAQSGGSITSDAGSDIIARGVCWSTSPNPTIEDKKTSDAAGTGIFSSKLTGLIPSTTYYVRAYASNKKGTAYGIQVSFSTKSLSLITTVITSITLNSAKSGGTISTDGDSVNVSVRGICWGTQSSPTITNSKTTDGKGSGKYTSSMTDLVLGTTYYVRAFATNSGGTYYGNELSFMTQNGAMTLTTTTATSITATSATVGGSVPNDGGSPVTERGICISKLPSPTIANKMANGSGIGSFATNITGLTANTTYYVRAYATNTVSTTYGNEISFTTLNGTISLSTSNASSITITTAIVGGTISIDGGAAVTARGVCWSPIPNPTIVNSKTTDGNGIGTFTSLITGLTANTKYYVRSYATNSVNTNYGNEVSFTTPDGIISFSPSTANSITATSATIANTIISDGGAMITIRGVCWSTTSLPSITNSKTIDGTGIGVFTSTIIGLTDVKTYYVRAYATNAVGTVYGNQLSFTTNALGLPTITTTEILSTTITTASSGGNITYDGGASVTARGVCWSTSTSPTIANSKTSDGAGTGAFTSSLTGLTAGTTYYIRSYATNSVGTAYGIQVSFTTLLSNYGKVTDIDGNTYNTIVIGTQVWLVENLKTTKYKDGTAIPIVTDGTVWSSLTSPAYCYYNNDATSYKSTYGALYNWYTVNTAKLAPTGWHVATDAEWTTLENYVSANIATSGFVAKALAATTDWNPDTSFGSIGNDLTKNNSSSFTALPGGNRYHNNGPFSDLGYNGYWWCSTESNATNAWLRRLYYNTNSMNKYNNYKQCGFSVRCVKDY
ncbi:MAG: fibrobacter succinogenes major paralogous domain-containing protein [Paludibacter sp.]